LTWIATRRDHQITNVVTRQQILCFHDHGKWKNNGKNLVGGMHQMAIFIFLLLLFICQKSVHQVSHLLENGVFHWWCLVYGTLAKHQTLDGHPIDK